MAYDETMAARIREALAQEPVVEEKAMFGGVCFMVDEKMFVCVKDDRTMWRVGAEVADTVVEEPGVAYMAHGKSRMKDFVYVDNEAIRSARELARWMQLAKAHNAVVLPAKGKKKKKA